MLNGLCMESLQQQTMDFIYRTIIRTDEIFNDRR